MSGLSPYRKQARSEADLQRTIRLQITEVVYCLSKILGHCSHLFSVTISLWYLRSVNDINSANPPFRQFAQVMAVIPVFRSSNRTPG